MLTLFARALIGAHWLCRALVQSAPSPPSTCTCPISSPFTSGLTWHISNTVGFSIHNHWIDQSSDLPNLKYFFSLCMPRASIIYVALAIAQNRFSICKIQIWGPRTLNTEKKIDVSQQGDFYPQKKHKVLQVLPLSAISICKYLSFIGLFDLYNFVG